MLQMWRKWTLRLKMFTGFKKRIKGATLCCAGGYPNWSAQLPTLKITVSGIDCCALLDSGCSRSVISPSLAKFGGEFKPTRQRVIMMNGESVICNLTCVVQVEISGIELSLNCLVAKLLPKYQALLGMDVVSAMGGVTIEGDGVVKFKALCIGAVAETEKGLSVNKKAETEDIVIEDCDFNAVFANGNWTVQWNWKDEDKSPTIENQVPMYKISEDAKGAFDNEVQEWIKSGWLQPYNGEFDGLIPLMAVIQQNKDKVRPVMDYRELNQYVSSHTAGSEVCGEKLRLWRRLGEQVCTIDLRKAYLQIHVAQSLWKFQVVQFKGEIYCLTRLGFGLSVAPKIMSSIVNKVLSMDPVIRSATDSYVDDIIVNEQIVDSDVVMEMLEKYGLSAKPAEPLDGNRVLGLRLNRINGKLMWGRGNKLKPLSEVRTKKDVFSLCGQLIGHYPVAGWLRPACSFVKRHLSDLKWGDMVGETTQTMLANIMNGINEKDPVGGKWAVCNSEEGRLWCDASSLAIGVCIEIDGEIIEDASWLRKQDDLAHINLAELEALLKGVNLALCWGLKRIDIVTDSATVHAWVSSILTGDRRIKTHGMSEALVRRRLCLLKDLILECGLSVQIKLVKSQFNKADNLTRVPKRWLSRKEETGVAMVCEKEVVDLHVLIKQVHSMHHFGVNRTFFTIKRCYPNIDVSKQDVERAIKYCKECLTIDPTTIKWDPGHLDCDQTWDRIAIDVTHYGTSKYMTIVDCGPSRFSIWRRIQSETKDQISKVLLEIFAERGPPRELLMDNSATFRCEQIEELCEKWNVKRLFRCVNRPSGNGIVERNHRTIKRMAARTKGSIQEMVYWYNITPKEGLSDETSPSSQLFSYKWRCKGEPSDRDEYQGKEFSIGESVFVKPKNPRCTSRWVQGVVTGHFSPTTVEVDGRPHHIADVRRVSGKEKHPEEEYQDGDDTTGACAYN